MEKVQLGASDQIERAAHSKLKYTCEVCGNDFARYYNLERHRMDSETNLENLKPPSKCHICGNQFSFDSGPEMQSIVHGSNPDSRCSFKCHVCGKQYSRKWILKSHMKIHGTNPDLTRPFECGVCGKRFMCDRYLKAHLRIHETDPVLKWPFKCDVCGNRFFHNHNLKEHMRIHETDPNFSWPFKCDACEKQYYKKISLEKHMRKFHKNDPDLRYSSESATCKEPSTRMKDGLESLKINQESGTDFRHLSVRDTFDVASAEEYDLRYPRVTHESNPDMEYYFQSSMQEGGFEESDMKLKSIHQETNSDLPILGAVCRDNIDLNVHTIAEDNSSDLQFPSVGDVQICRSEFPAAATSHEEWIDDFLVESLLDFCPSTC